MDGNFNSFVMSKISHKEYVSAMENIELSQRLVQLQAEYRQNSSALLLQRPKNRPSQKTNAHGEIVSTRICIGIPVTSKGTVMTSVQSSPFWANFFDSFMRSIDWRSNRFVFRIAMGFDKADTLYDTGDAWTEIREEFRKRASFRMSEQHLDQIAINSVLRDTLTLKLMHFDDLNGAPSQVVSQLMLQAYSEDEFDYFYQVS